MVFADDTYAARTRRGICCARTVRFLGMAFNGKYVAAAAAGWELARVAMVGTCDSGGRGSSHFPAVTPVVAAPRGRGGPWCVPARAPGAPPRGATNPTPR